MGSLIRIQVQGLFKGFSNRGANLNRGHFQFHSEYKSLKIKSKKHSQSRMAMEIRSWELDVY